MREIPSTSRRPGGMLPVSIPLPGVFSITAFTGDLTGGDWVPSQRRPPDQCRVVVIDAEPASETAKFCLPSSPQSALQPIVWSLCVDVNLNPRVC
jgi:hypothetical protein